MWQAFKWVTILHLWREYKQYFGILVVSLALMVFVSYLHVDLRELCLDTKKEDWLPFLLFIKWFLWILVFFVAYWRFSKLHTSSEPEILEEENKEVEKLSVEDVIKRAKERKAKKQKN